MLLSFKKRFIDRGFIVLMILFTLASCQNHSQQKQKQSASITAVSPQQSSDYYPVSLKNAGREITFSKSPQRVVTMMQQDAELLLALGLKDKIAGYSLVSDYTPDKYKKALTGIRVLAKNTPSKEAVLKVNPDFIIGTEATFISNAVGTRQWLSDLGIQSYIVKNQHPATLENQVYLQIRDMAKIFNVQKKGEQLIEKMQAQVNKITHQLGDIKTPLKVVYLAGGKGSAPRAAGGNSLDSYLMKLAGGENIFKELNGYLVQVSWEEIVARNPEVIVISYCCGGNPDDLIDLIKSKSALQNVSAVKNNRFVPVLVEETTGSMRIPTGLKKLAKGFYPHRFQ